MRKHRLIGLNLCIYEVINKIIILSVCNSGQCSYNKMGVFFVFWGEKEKVTSTSTPGPSPYQFKNRPRNLQVQFYGLC